MTIRVVRFFLLLGLIIPQLIHGQISRIQESLPPIIPMSPEVAGMARYSGYPVNFYSGLPEISIPLFEIKTKDMSVPIVLRYHASGIKVADIASWVGLGWTLDAGGMINRRLFGKPDEEAPGPQVREAEDIDIMDDNDYIYYLNYSLNKLIDTEPDIYYYQYPGNSGSFQFLNGSAFMMPLSPVKVQRSPIYKITEPNGTSYHFTHALSPQTYYPTKSGSDPVSSWLLTKILNTSKSDSIQFSYQSAGFGTLAEDRVDHVFVDDQTCKINSQCSVNGFEPQIYYQDGVIFTTSGEETVNSEISFNGGKILFVLSNNSRLDRESSFKSLDTIKIFSSADLSRPFRYVIFHKSYFINGINKRLRLDSLRFADKNKMITQCFKFDYHTENSLPEYNSRSKDWWGYFNGRNNTFLIPKQLVPFNQGCYDVSAGCQVPGNGCDYIGNEMDAREPDTAKMKAYIIKTITYPTGGKTSFNFESHRYFEGSTAKFTGGLRIKSMSTDDGNGNVQKKTYEYVQSRNNTFLFNSFFKTVSTVIASVSDGTGCSTTIHKRSTIYSSNPSCDINPYDGSSVVYPIVTEYFGDELMNTGKIVYSYNDLRDTSIFLSGHFNESQAPSLDFARTHDDKFKIVSRAFQRGQLLTKSIYKNENNSYKLVNRIENQYGVFAPITIDPVAVYVWRSDIYGGGGFEGGCRSQYEYDNYPAFTADNMLKYTAEYSYDQNDELKYVKNETFYSYNSPQYLQVNKIKTIRSDGDTLIRVIKYPTDLSTDIANGMVSSNLIGIPVEDNEFLESVPLTSTRANFTKKYFNKFYAPSSVEQRTGTSAWKTKMWFLSYDANGNIVSARKEKGFPVSYAYDSNNQPVAEILNADSLSFYFNNFENADGDSPDGDCKTGHKSRLNGFNRTIPLASGSYVLTYWQKMGVEWVYVKTSITASSGTYAISRSGQIDDLRIYPAAALMTTYTYDPSIGMTSKTDPNGVTTYYEYDAFGRLKFIRNDRRQIVKSYDYHYQSTE